MLPSTRLLSLFLGRETESQSFGAPRCRSKVRARKLILKHLTPVLRGAAARRNPESPPGWCRVSGSHLSYWSRSSKTSWDWFLTHRQSHTYTHEHARTHTPTHTHARRRADAHFWRAGVCRAGGVVGPWQFRAGAGGKESTRAPPDEPGCSGEKPAASATGRRGTSRAPNSGARPITSAASASFYSQRGLPFPGCLALEPPLRAPGPPSLLAS